MGVFLTPADLEPFATIDQVKAESMIEDAEAMAALAAPCITNPEFMIRTELMAAVKAVLRSAVLRWNEAGAGAVTQRGAGPFQETVDNRQQRRTMFWPSEVEQLRDICAQFGGTSGGGAFEVDTMPPGAGAGRHGVDYWWPTTTDREWL